jgi:predicted O-methyltransferase YrrM
VCGEKLPCWRNEDLDLEEEKWLTASNYYPLYFEVFKALRPDKSERVKFLEFGVRTGYMGAVFMKAIDGAKSYMGIDPNLYLADGLSRATATLEILTENSSGINHQFIKGYSTFQAYLGSMEEYGPFDFIHIDGEHTLKGKVIDLFVAKDLVKKDGYVLIDDFNHVGIVAPAVKAALEMGWYKSFSYVPTLRGLAILKT